MLQSYINEVRRLLRDSKGNFFPLPDPNGDLTGAVNEGRIAAAYDTGCVRQLLPIGTPGTQLILKQEFYPYSAVTVGGTALVPLDVMDIYVTYSGVRNALNYMAYSASSRTDWRRLVGYSDIPRVFSVYGQSVAVSPLPSQNFPAEWDIIPQIPTLIDDTTPETIPVPFQIPIPYYAAFKAYLWLQQTAKAKEMFNFYMAQTQFAGRRQFQRRLGLGAPYWNN